MTRRAIKLNVFSVPFLKVTFLFPPADKKQIICQFQENKSHWVVKWQEVIGRELKLKLLRNTLYSCYRHTKTLFVLDKKWRTDQSDDRGNNFPMEFPYQGLFHVFYLSSVDSYVMSHIALIILCLWSIFSCAELEMNDENISFLSPSGERI